MKILHVLSQMPDFTGSGKTLQAIIKQAKARGFKNYMVAGIQNDFEPDPSLIPMHHALFVHFNGGPGLDFPLPGMSDVMPYQSTVFSSMGPEQLAQYQDAFERKLQQAKKDFAPDIIHTHHLWIVSKIARWVFADRPMVTSCHGTCLRQFSLCPRIGPEIAGAVRKIDRILCLGHHQKEAVMQIHGVDPERLRVVGAGFENDLFGFGSVTARDAKPDTGPVEIVYAGKLSRAKGVPWLLRSIKKVSRLNFRLHLAGSGSGREKDECLALAESLGDRVVVHGPLSHRDLAGLMKTAHLFVLPSFFEGLPLVIMEALSSGCRILTTALPGTREILGSTQSPMVEMIPLPPLETVDTPFEKDMPGMEEKLAAALEKSIQTILDHRQPDMDWAGKITRAYTWEKVFSRMAAAYEEACLSREAS
ncbi:MAG: glycosyltransferase family 4 protein [Desulfobacter sp.]|nr:MAG: glycosyltransferase family 4 protein [Desulfobacter sp.]